MDICGNESARFGNRLSRKDLVANCNYWFGGSADMSDVDKVMAARDYLIQFCSYAPDWSKNRANTAWGALVYRQAQCSGYARAMKALCDSIGVECCYVHADAAASNPSHQWNTVKIGHDVEHRS